MLGHMQRKEVVVKEILEKELQKAKQKNPRYSLRALAKKLNVSPSTLSRLLAGKSNLSRSMANKILERVPLGPQERDALRRLEHDPYQVIVTEGDYRQLVDHWFISPIMCLAETRDFRPEPRWIAKRLGISPHQAKLGLNLLKRIGFLREAPSGKLVPQDIAITTKAPSHQPKPNQLHLAYLEQLRSSLLDPLPRSIGISDVSSIVVGTGLKKIPEAKRRIARFRRSLAKYLDSGEKEEAYLVFIQLIPLSRR